MNQENQKLNLLIAFHCNIPVNGGKPSLTNKESEENVKSQCDFVQHITNLLDSCGNIKASFYLSSNLILCLDRSFTNFINQIRILIEKNSVELLSGGMYEPILPLIPNEDRQLQISLMNRFLNHTFGYIPHGAWITEHIWDQSIALDLSKSKISYVCLPKEYVMDSTDLKETELNGYFITEEMGRKVAIFPITYELNALFETCSPDEILEYLLKCESNCSSENPVIVLTYDKNKTKNNQTEKLAELINILNSHKSIETKLFHQIFAKNKPLGRIYIPGYEKNGISQKPVNQKSFLLKSYEANLLHKKMLRVSKKINSAKEGKSRFKVIKEMINKAQELLLQGQNFNPFLCQDNNGIISPALRHFSYSNLIKAENLTDIASRSSSKWIQVSETDYDCDGNDEIIIESESQNIYMAPSAGGTIIEHDFKQNELNINNTFSSAFQGHGIQTNGSHQVSKDFKLHFLDHFLDQNTTMSGYKTRELNHLTRRIIHPCEIEKIKAKEEICKITLNLKTQLVKLENVPEISLVKQFSVPSGESSLIAEYSIINRSQNRTDFIFAVEFNFNITPVTDEKSFFYLNGDKTNKTTASEIRNSEELSDITQISVFSNNQKADLSFIWNKPCQIFRQPICSYNSDSKIFQGNNMFALWHLYLEPEIPWEVSVRQNFKLIIDEI